MPWLRLLLGLIVGAVGAPVLRRVSERLPDAPLFADIAICRSCGQRIAPWRRLPLVASTGIGKCPACGSAQPRQVWLETLSIVGTMAVFWRDFGTPSLYVAVLVLWLAITAAAIDIRLRIIPNRLLLAAAVLGAVALAPLGVAGYTQGILGTLVLFAIGSLMAIMSRGGFGFGDVKYLAVVGLLLGLRPALAAFFVAIVTGGLYAAGLLVMRRAGRQDTFAFGPFIAIGSVAVALFAHTPVR